MDQPALPRNSKLHTPLTSASLVGKTALAVHWSHLARDRVPDGDLYIDLQGYHPTAAPMQPDEALRLLLAALDVPADDMPMTTAERTARFRTLMVGRRTLLLLDNARTAEQIRPLLPGTTSCIVIITSRHRLGGVVARDGVHRLILDVLTAEDARRLLRRIIGAERVDAEPGAVAALADLCGYHPLALRIAAERVTVQTDRPIGYAVDDLTDERQRLDALATGDDDLSAIRAVFTWSYAALTDVQQRAFRFLGLHDGPDFTIPSMAALIGQPIETCGSLMAELVSAHLIEEAKDDRYRLHDLLRLLARECGTMQDPREQRRAAVERLTNWYLHSASAARTSLDPNLPPMELAPQTTPIAPATFTSHAGALAWTEEERANLVAASASAYEFGHARIAWQLPTALYPFFNLRKHYADGIATHETAAAAAKALADSEAQGRVLCNLGNAYRPLGRMDEATACYEQALDHFRACGYRQGEAKVLGNLSSVHNDSGRYHEAIETSRSAVTLFQEIGDRYGEALALANQANAQVAAGAFDTAVTCLRRSSDIFTELADPSGQARAIANLGALELRRGNPAAAVDLITEALRRFRDLGDRFEEALSLTDLAEAAAMTSDPDQVQQSLRAAHDIFRDLGNHERQADIAARLADTL